MNRLGAYLSTQSMLELVESSSIDVASERAIASSLTSKGSKDRACRYARILRESLESQQRTLWRGRSREVCVCLSVL